jgi:lipopolysaccharide export system protein LptA
MHPSARLFCLITAGLFAAMPLSDAKEPAAKPAPAASSAHGGIEFAKSDAPLDVTADQGIEFSQDAKEIIAHVNARATRGNATVLGDRLIAYYRPKAADAGKLPPADSGKAPDDQTSASEIWRVVADGAVEIFNPTQHAYGDHADYNIDEAVVVMTGDHLKMTTPQDVITARDTLEYWEQKRQAVARGNAVAVRAEKRIQADLLVADLGENAQKQLVIQTAHGYDHVVLTTATDVVTGDRADYVVETGIVTVTGSVKMTRQNNQLNGGYAVVNLNTGISTLYPAPPGGKAGDRQVKGMFVPQKKAPPPAAPAPAPKAP